MKKLIHRFGKLITTSLFIIAFGIVCILLTPLLYTRWEIDTDIPGLIIVCIGLAICLFGIIRRNKVRGWKLVLAIIIGILLLLPSLSMIISIIYYLITGKALGE